MDGHAEELLTELETTRRELVEARDALRLCEERLALARTTEGRRAVRTEEREVVHVAERRDGHVVVVTGVPAVVSIDGDGIEHVSYESAVVDPLLATIREALSSATALGVHIRAFDRTGIIVRSADGPREPTSET